jgi:hypothetical protein
MKNQDPNTNKRCLGFIAILFCALLVPTSTGAPASKEKTYSGEWNNRKYNTKGALTCRLTPTNERTWKAKFTGTGLGRPFSYDATLTAGRKGNQIVLQGVSSVDGERYNWAGNITGSSLTGSYRSATGNNGSFSLKIQP